MMQFKPLETTFEHGGLGLLLANLGERFKCEHGFSYANNLYHLCVSNILHRHTVYHITIVCLQKKCNTPLFH